MYGKGAKCNILVMGVGGAGNNAVRHLIEAGIDTARFLAVNTDEQALSQLEDAPNCETLVIGRERTGGQGAGANPQIGEEAANESIEIIKDKLKNVHLLFIAAGMGGGTGTGAAPIIAREAKEKKILTVAIVTKPFNYEARVRMERAIEGISKLEKYVDAMIVIPNDKLLQLAKDGMTMEQSFKLADKVLEQGIKGISDLIIKPAIINLDFADVSTVLRDSKRAHLGVGEAEGDNRVINALHRAMSSPILETKIEGARGVVILVSGGPADLKADEGARAVEEVRKICDPDVNLIFGVGTDEQLNGKIKITLIATGFPDPQANKGIVGDAIKEKRYMQEPTPNKAFTTPQYNNENDNHKVNTGFNNPFKKTENRFSGIGANPYSNYNNDNIPSSTIDTADRKVPGFIKKLKGIKSIDD